MSGRSDTTYEERVLMDSWYVHNWSVWIDIVYLLKLCWLSLNRKGPINLMKYDYLVVGQAHLVLYLPMKRTSVVNLYLLSIVAITLPVICIVKAKTTSTFTCMVLTFSIHP